MVIIMVTHVKTDNCLGIGGSNVAIDLNDRANYIGEIVEVVLRPADSFKIDKVGDDIYFVMPHAINLTSSQLEAFLAQRRMDETGRIRTAPRWAHDENSEYLILTGLRGDVLPVEKKNIETIWVITSQCVVVTGT